MGERWHIETSNFHLPIGKMSITLDDVLHILIEERMLNHPKKVFQVTGVEMMVRYLSVSQNVVVSNCKDEYGAYISYKALNEIYEDRLNVATRLANARTMKDLEERVRRGDACVRSFILDVCCLVIKVTNTSS